MMDVPCTLYHVDLDPNRRRIMGEYSSPLKALEAFKERHKKKLEPYHGGTLFVYDKVTLDNQLRELPNKKTSIRIWSNGSTEVYIQWDVVDKPLP